MAVAATEAEAITAVLQNGDTVRVSLDAYSASGNSVLNARGKVAKLDFFDSFEGWLVRPADGTASQYVAARYLSKLTETDVLTENLNKLTAKVDSLTTELAAERASRTRFVESVSEALSDAVGNDSDLFDPLNSIASVLGLESLTREFEVTVSFEGRYTTTVNATDEDDAADLINSSTVLEYIRDSENYIDLTDYTTETELV